MNTDEAFEVFWRAHYGSVTRVVSAICGDVQDGQEIAQEAFARAYQHWRRVSAMERPDAWVHKVAANLSISTLRRSSRGFGDARRGAVPAPEPPDDELLRAMRALSPAQRAVICLRFYLDWSIDDVAEALGKRPGTVRALTHQGMQRLRAELTKEPQDE